MPLSNTQTRYSYSGNDVTTEFSYPNKWFDNTDLVVDLIVDATGVATTQVLDTDYTLSGVGNDAGGTVTMTVAPATGETLLIYRSVPFTQSLDYIEGDGFPADSHEEGLDRLTALCQQIKTDTDRKLGFNDDYVGGASAVLPNPEALNYLRWNVSADALENTTSVSSVVASDVPFTPSGDLSATDVQAALIELDTDKLNSGDIGSTVQGYSADTPTSIIPLVTLQGGTDTDSYAISAERFREGFEAFSTQLAFRTNNTTETLTSAELDNITLSSITSATTKTLPPVSGLVDGTKVGFCLISSTLGRLTVACNGADTIRIGNGSVTSLDLSSDGDFITMCADRNNNRWFVLVDRIKGPLFKATYSGTGQTLTATVYTKLEFSVENEDTHDCYDSTTNYRFTPNIPGIYEIKLGCYISAFSGTGPKRIASFLYKNGSYHEAGNRIDITDGGDGFLQSSWQVEMNGSTDYVEAYARSVDGGIAGEFNDPTNLEPLFYGRRMK